MADKPPMIVVGVDKGPTGSLALDAAIPLAKDLSANLCLAYAFRPMAPTTLSADSADSPFHELQSEADMADAMDLTQQYAKKARLQGVETTVFTASRAPSATILDAAQQHGAIMIIVGTHSRTGITHWVLGSVAEDVVRRSRVPVLVVPNLEAHAGSHVAERRAKPKGIFGRRKKEREPHV